MRLRDGGPAFPVPVREGEVWDGGYPDGLSIRDWFAGQAMAAFCANPVTNDVYRDEPWPQVVGKLAESAYEAADAMLAARESEGR